VRVAAAASSGVSVSARLELYPAGMPAERALEECRAALLDRHGLGPGAVADRVRARFPEAAPLPGRPELDRLLEPLGLRWNASEGKYVLEVRGGILGPRSSTTARTTSFASPDERDAAVRDTEERFARIAWEGGFLALTVDRRRIAEAVPAVAARLGATALELDRLLIAAMREQAAAAGADWNVLLLADAAERGDRRWNLLQRLVERALPRVETRLYRTSGVAVLSGLGLLARYDRMQVVERLRDALTRRGGDHPLTGAVIVVPGEDPSARPVVDGHPVPVVTANQWAHLPSAWLIQPAKGEAA
jgi:hypothetical protein